MDFTSSVHSKYSYICCSYFNYAVTLISDAHIINGLKKSNENLFDVLFTSYFSRLTAFAVEYVDDEEIAKNLVQDTFVTLWSRKTELDEEINLNAWLYSTVKFHCMNYLRSVKVSTAYQEKAITKLQATLNYYSLSELDTSDLTFKEIERIVELTLEQLPEQCRKVFKLSRFDYKKNREIAKELDISIKTVESHMAKALKSMRIALKDYLPLLLPFI